MREQKPLYRKVNTRARGVHHGGGGDYSWTRNSRAEKRGDAVGRGSMHSNMRNGLDYTPLFRFLLSKVGGDWDEIFGAAAARLDRPEPTFWLVARNEADKRPFVRVGDSSYYSGLFIDENNRLALVDPQLRVEDMEPSCACCTHTFNGAPFVKKFKGVI